MHYKTVKPVFKYIGGKGWLKDTLREEIQKLIKIKNPTGYVEPFAGGLGAFLGVYDVLLENGIKTVTLNDINEKLINFYQVVAKNPLDLINEYMKLEGEFSKTVPSESIGLHGVKDKDKLKSLLKNSEIYFKKIRESFNGATLDPTSSAAHIFFLQNHSFNGIYRENSFGNYNTPFNWSPKIFTKEVIEVRVKDVHEVFAQFNITFTKGSFDKLIFNGETLYYLDPPYINDDLVENKYNKDFFGIDQQKLLIKTIKDVTFIYSNHDNDILLKEFEKVLGKVVIKRIPRKNIISASMESRKNDKMEILLIST